MPRSPHKLPNLSRAAAPKKTEIPISTIPHPLSAIWVTFPQNLYYLRPVHEIKNYQFLCKRRGYHRPNEADEANFKQNTKFPKYTVCQDCNFGLELKINEQNPDQYWVIET